MGSYKNIGKMNNARKVLKLLLLEIGANFGPKSTEENPLYNNTESQSLLWNTIYASFGNAHF